MTMKMIALVGACLLCTTLANNEANTQSMASIMSSMSPNKAVEVLKKSSLATPELIQIANVALGKSRLRKQPKGYGGLDGARKLLNDMIYESMSKYDAEIAKCTEYYSTQCAAMEACRGQISASNYIAANSRSLILDSQATINKCEVDIPTRKLELKNHLAKCKRELSRMNTRLKIVMGDIAVMTIILKMTDCKKKLLQMRNITMLRCTDQCTHKSFIEFNQGDLKQKVAQLQSSVSHELMQDTFKDLFEGIESLESIEFLELGARQSPVVNKTKFNNPPVPKPRCPRILATIKMVGHHQQPTSVQPSAPWVAGNVTNCRSGFY